MRKEDLVKLGLSEDLAAKVADAFTLEIKGYIPKERFDEVNSIKRQLEKDITIRDAQIEDLKNSSGDIDKLKSTILLLEESSAKEKEMFEFQLRNIRKDSAVEKALISAKAKNTKAVRALICDFLETADLDGEGVSGLDAELQRLMESEDSKFLFDNEIKAKPLFKGIIPGDKKDGTPKAGNEGGLADAVRVYFEGN